MNKFFKKIASAWARMPHWTALLVFLVLGIGIGVGVFYAVWSYKSKSNFKLPAPVVQNENQPPSNVVVPTSTQSDQNIITSEYGDTYDPNFGVFIYKSSTPELDNRVIRVSVDWQTPSEINPQEAENLLAQLKLPKGAISEPLGTSEAMSFGSLWRLGNIKGGEFSGSDLYLLQTAEGGLGVYYHYAFIFVPKDGKLRVFGNDNEGFLIDRMINLPNVTLNQKAPLSTLIYQNDKKLEKINVSRWDSSRVYKFIDLKSATFTKDVLSKEGFQFFKQEDLPGVRAVFLDSGEVQYFSPILPGVEKDYNFIPSIFWDSFGKNTDSYVMFPTGGCGISSNLENVVSDQDISTLNVIGKTSEGDPVYYPKDPKNNEFVQNAYDLWFLPDGQEKPGMDGFLKKYPRPIFFWQNAFGDWVLGRHKDLQPQVECGKPVIYLYPTKTTDVSVKLPSFINVTVSDPAYPVRGWNVVAHADGSLDYANGKTYGSLYWEGTGVNYQTPRQGFVVKDGEQKEFLTTTLAKYGLNQKESQEFMDFWLPKMTGAPYYRVSFLVEDWSKAAPLYVNPRPDTNIRIFMDWQKLSSPVKITEPKIVTPVRNGFTLVEWGGLLYR